MIPINITLQYMRDGSKESKRFRLSMDDAVDVSLAHILDDLKLPREDDHRILAYRLVKQRQMLDEDDTLMQAGVQEGDILQLTTVDPKATLGLSMSASVLARLGGKSNSEPLPLVAALVDPAGKNFVLQHTRALIGRSDASLGYPPEALDADLTELDPERTVSRPHALIVYNNGEFTIRDLYSQRGVQVNNTPISPSKSEVLHDGDMLTLGSVRVQFRCRR